MPGLDLKIPEGDEKARSAAKLSERLEKTIYLTVDVGGKSIGQPSVNKLVAARDGTTGEGCGFDTYKEGRRVNYTGTEGCRDIIKKGSPA